MSSSAHVRESPGRPPTRSSNFKTDCTHWPKRWLHMWTHLPMQTPEAVKAEPRTHSLSMFEYWSISSPKERLRKLAASEVCGLTVFILLVSIHLLEFNLPYTVKPTFSKHHPTEQSSTWKHRHKAVGTLTHVYVRLCVCFVLHGILHTHCGVKHGHGQKI